jgi:hypothetical protein
LGGVREEGVEPPVWSVLAEAARTALTRLVTVQARVVEVVPVRGFAGESQSRTVTVAWASPDLWRIDDGEGLLLLRDGRRHIERDETGVHRHRPRDPAWVPGDFLSLGWGHPDLFRDPHEFETPVRGPSLVDTATGRDGWEVLLVAPGNKPYPLTVVIDHITGLQLSHAAVGTPYRSTVVELSVDEPLPEDTFSWDGPTWKQQTKDKTPQGITGGQTPAPQHLPRTVQTGNE